ncbi:MAG: DegV family protein [Oscillospiraceae bacterium]|jgi:DegV family protein with EDD domain|nr:DegV family protein [Oscillospiraceae bacterium]
MADYVIVTDSSCDLPDRLAREYEIVVLPLSFHIKGKDYFNYLDEREMPISEFYSQIRAGEPCTTSAVNVAAYKSAIEPLLQQGKNILDIAFSSGLSATYSSAKIACDELSEKYPERKIFAVDTLAASLGQGLLVYLAACLQREGKKIEEVRDWVEQNKLSLCHWFTVDDLNHLKRGGRISGATALFGTMLNIKPIMHVDDEGRLIPVGKVRGRRASLDALADHMEETAVNPASQTVFISHGDCLKDAEYLAAEIKRRMGVKNFVIGNVGPVIGAHSGPGTMALFFLGTRR